ncbi:hypothetical protein [Kitasatospora sp. KL5]|uniref:hypothetical protein n=1 Tax=Kitasatospora sp. KL5 TaxID=3425125 RepID=UPI003D6DF93F
MSQLVQKGLALLAPKEEPYRPEWAVEALADAASRLREAARVDYEEGFRAGYELAKVAPWDWVLWLADKDFNLRWILSTLWRGEYDPTPEIERELERVCRSKSGWPTEWYQALYGVFDAEMASPGGEMSAYRSDQFMAGVEQAFRDVWAYANQVAGR